MAETAIIVPVDPAEAVVGRWRREHTPSGSKGMQAHITLLAPFTPPEQLVAGRIREVRDVLAEFQRFEFELADAAYLDLGCRRVLYLRPEPAGPFVDLISGRQEVSRAPAVRKPRARADPAPDGCHVARRRVAGAGRSGGPAGAPDLGHGERSPDRRVRRAGLPHSQPDPSGSGRLTERVGVRLGPRPPLRRQAVAVEACRP